MSVYEELVESLRTEKRIAAVAGALLRDGPLDDVSDAEMALLRSADRIPAGLARETGLWIREGRDPLGDAFLASRSPSVRRKSGATYTPDAIVDSMIAWLKSEGRPDRIVDPGAGSGRFAIAAGREFPRARIVANELDPLALLMLRANLTTLGLGDRTTVVAGDYRSMKLGSGYESTAFLGNPPYVRHHLLDRKWKEWLSRESQALGLQASQLAGLHVHFFLATALKASPGDFGTFITSAEWLDVNYGRLVRELLLGYLGGVGVHVIDPRAMPFEGTATTGAITCFHIGTQRKTMRLRKIKSVESLNGLKGGRNVSKKRLSETRRWTHILRAPVKLPPGYVELGELCRVHRGAVTGSNATWITTRDESPLPDRVLFPSVTRARELFAAGTTLASPDGLRCVIDLPVDLDELEDEERRIVEKFLRRAKRQGVHKGYIARNRKRWWAVGLREPAPIIATYMARRPPAFVRNEADARHINIAHGLYPREELEATTLDRLADYLRETVSMARGRTYAGGLTKFEPREMERIPVPDLPLLLEQVAS